VGAVFPDLSLSKVSRDKPPVIPESVAGGYPESRFHRFQKKKVLIPRMSPTKKGLT
jgi:hypothetical protein